ncbi:hypothetical protein AUEXF2481DRAFT_41037 [Aureobasidium subglaciale EXF-2481]|uniref:Uncharacterized protein n=1 Tax=Aureobasidium subglaciale (strain EXF-2481) TaxID=1043005 RepID=A0A074Z663_AURSE|nr:uncharacterized protein AUEXF2481DRAFT_41037 [Aureobasidium subglaciale EXF-2481]KEQ94446.1 hypothetical protein AUEXF2481DRAFT_41037 [Aureobasidium subglaciale EXF-2481]
MSSLSFFLHGEELMLPVLAKIVIVLPIVVVFFLSDTRLFAGWRNGWYSGHKVREKVKKTLG